MRTKTRILPGQAFLNRPDGFEPSELEPLQEMRDGLTFIVFDSMRGAFVRAEITKIEGGRAHWKSDALQGWLTYGDGAWCCHNWFPRIVAWDKIVF